MYKGAFRLPSALKRQACSTLERAVKLLGARRAEIGHQGTDDELNVQQCVPPHHDRLRRSPGELQNALFWREVISGTEH